MGMFSGGASIPAIDGTINTPWGTVILGGGGIGTGPRPRQQGPDMGSMLLLLLIVGGGIYLATR